jgi:hypothetical protein
MGRVQFVWNLLATRNETLSHAVLQRGSMGRLLNGLYTRNIKAELLDTRNDTVSCSTSKGVVWTGLINGLYKRNIKTEMWCTYLLYLCV